MADDRKENQDGGQQGEGQQAPGRQGDGEDARGRQGQGGVEVGHGVQPSGAQKGDQQSDR